MEKKLSAYRGCLLGLAVGDAMGYTVDTKSWAEICECYGPNGLMGYDLANGTAEVTSYTQIAAFLCNGLLLAAIRGNPEYTTKYMVLSLREWLKSQQFRTTTEKTRCWVAQVPALRRRVCMDTRMLDFLGREILGTPQAPMLRSVTPAALTGAIAVGMSYDPERMTLPQLMDLGASAVAFTHGDPETFLSGAFLACALGLLLQNTAWPLRKVFEEASRQLLEQYGDTFPEADLLCSKIAYALSLTVDPEITPLVAMTMLGCTTAAECTAGAVYTAAVHAGNFDEAMITSVNHSGRSAAVGALAGAFLGARLGADALPEFYLECLEPVPWLEDLAQDMTEGRQVVKIFDDSWDQKYIQGQPTR